MINQKDSFVVGEVYFGVESQLFPRTRLILYIFKCIKKGRKKISFELIGRYQQRYLEDEWEEIDIPRKKIYEKLPA